MIKQFIIRILILERQNKNYFSSLKQQSRRAVSPILLGILLLVGLWWLMPSIPAYAADPIFTDSGQELGNANTLSIALGDLNSDGHLDAFVTNGSAQLDSGEINQVWLNDGRGNFSDSGQRLGDSDSVRVALGDLDGDGDLDAFVPNIGLIGREANKVWLNDGVGTFSDNGQNLGNSLSTTVALGDLDGDGDLDAFVTNAEVCILIVICSEDNHNKVWLNDGRGHFTDSGQLLGDSNSTTVGLGDLDGDGDLDAFVTNGEVCISNVGCYGEVKHNKVWLNNGTGVFSDSNQNLGESDSTNVALGDLDRDGDLDAFVVNGNIIDDEAIKEPDQVWLNNGTGHFSEGQSLGNSASAAVTLGDIDSDGDLDAFVGNVDRSGEANQVWVNDGAGRFQSGESIGHSNSTAVALGDLDGDNDLDAFIGNFGANKVWFNQSAHFHDSGQSLVHSLA